MLLRLVIDMFLSSPFFKIRLHRRYVTGLAPSLINLKTLPGDTAKKWEGLDYRWSAENLARLQKQPRFSSSGLTVEVLPGTLQ